MRSEHTPDFGLDVLADAFHLIRSAIPNVELWLIGQVRSDAASHLDRLREFPEAKILGFLEHSRVMALIRKADVCVLPWHKVVDLDQTYPTKVMEYMTEGKVVVAARLSGIAEMIKDGYNGVLFPPGDAKALAERVISLYRDSQVRKTITQNAKQYNEKFDTRAKHRKIMESLIALSGEMS
jgi:glycosyltransferase involved in cell wall biosynthesis